MRIRFGDAASVSAVVIHSAMMNCINNAYSNFVFMLNRLDYIRFDFEGNRFTRSQRRRRGGDFGSYCFRHGRRAVDVGSGLNAIDRGFGAPLMEYRFLLPYLLLLNRRMDMRVFLMHASPSASLYWLQPRVLRPGKSVTAALTPLSVRIMAIEKQPEVSPASTTPFKVRDGIRRGYSSGGTIARSRRGTSRRGARRRSGLERGGMAIDACPMEF